MSSFTFGAKTTAPPAFGTGSITFGTAAPQPQNPQLNISGIAPQTSVGGNFQFGGAPTTSAPPPLFGASPANAPLNFKSSFGTPTTASTGLFGTSMPSTGLTFGTPTTSASAAPSTAFGLTPQTTSTALSFGTPSTVAPSTGLSFGTSPSTGLLGAPATTSTAPALALNFSSTIPSSTTSSFSFGTSTTTNAAVPNFSLGTSAATTSTGLSFGLGGVSTAAITTTAPSIVGLGGTATSQAKTSTLSAQKEIPAKDQPLPNEILQTVEQFKETVKQQKGYSSDIARCSINEFRKVEQEIDLLNNLLNEVESQLQKNRHTAEKLKYETAKCFQNVEMAQRTHDTPPGLQYENVAPTKYFLDLVTHFEHEMHSLKTQIDTVDKFAKNNQNPGNLGPQDLSLGMKRLHEIFVALAGRLQSVHTQVESQKDLYMILRRRLYNDSSNPFETLNQQLAQISFPKSATYSTPKVANGPTPFNTIIFGNGSALLQQQNQTAPPAYSNPTTSSTSGTRFGSSLMFSSIQTNQPSNTSLFGTSTFGQPLANTSGFQLQKPPLSNKRGKQ